jgi:S-adenosyl methyltransferase
VSQPDQATGTDSAAVAVPEPVATGTACPQSTDASSLSPGEMLARAGRKSLDSGLANVARIYDALLGGKDNYAADREAARRLIEVVPDAALAARNNRAFLARAVRYLTAQENISQFLDIGAGLPTRGNVHEVARAVNPRARVVYSDHDPVVVAHARALLADTPDVIAVEGDVRYPGHLLTLPAVREVIDFSSPVAVLLVAVLHFVPDSDSPWLAVRFITDHLAPGSYVVISHVASDEITPEAISAARQIYAGALVRGVARSRRDIARFFDGTDLTEPGLVNVAEWRPGYRARTVSGPALFCAGIGRKPDARLGNVGADLLGQQGASS